jgi:hypothetical protein
MDVQVKYLQHLVDALVRKHKVIKDRKGMEEICENVGVSEGYLYKKIANPIAKLQQNDSISLRTSVINRLLADLEFASMPDFIQHVDVPITRQAKSIVGSYYCYVRRNTKDGVLLRSPVEITENNRELIFLLVGERQNFRGEVKLVNGVVSILMRSGEGKFFHHVYKIGNVEKPRLLQGVFSGVTSAFDPIGGRVVLERREEKFATLRVGALDIAEMKGARVKGYNQLASYFSKYSDNNLKIGNSTSFSLDDLA